MAKRLMTFLIGDEDREKLDLIRQAYGWSLAVVLRAAIRLLFEKTGLSKSSDMPLNKE